MTRLVFDWNQPVLYSLVQRQGLATITFDRTAAADLSMLRVNPPAYLSSATAIEHDGRLAVVLTLKPGVTISDFREDLNVVLDLKPSSADAMPALEEEADGDAPDDAGDQVTTVAGAPKNLLPNAAHGEADEEDHARETSGAIPAETAHEAQAPLAANPLPQGKRPEGKAVVRFVAGRSGTDILVDWPEPVGAAVFERADRLWAVFDRVLPLDISEVTAQELGPFSSPGGRELRWRNGACGAASRKSSDRRRRGGRFMADFGGRGRSRRPAVPSAFRATGATMGAAASSSISGHRAWCCGSRPAGR